MMRLNQKETKESAHTTMRPKEKETKKVQKGQTFFLVQATTRIVHRLYSVWEKGCFGVLGGGLGGLV